MKLLFKQCYAAVLLGALSTFALPAAAQSVRTYTDIWGGSNNGAPGCAATFGPAPELQAFFNGGGFRAVGGNATCGYSGSTADLSSATGPLSTVRSLAPVALGNPADSYGSFGGSVGSFASYLQLGVEARGDLIGGASNTDATSAAAAAFSDDAFVASDASAAPGSSGAIRLTFAVDGSLQTAATPSAYHPSFAFWSLDYQLDGGAVYRAGSLSDAVYACPVLYAADGDLSGFASTENSISGSGLLRTVLLPIVYGTPFELRVGMLAQTSGEAFVDFLHTARIDQIELFDANGRLLADPDLIGRSGIDYLHPGAVAPVPEPETWALFVAGLAVIGGLGRRRRCREFGSGNFSRPA